MRTIPTSFRRSLPCRIRPTRHHGIVSHHPTHLSEDGSNQRKKSRISLLTRLEDGTLSRLPLPFICLI